MKKLFILLAFAMFVGATANANFEKELLARISTATK